MQVEITKLNHNGEGMSKIDGKIIFIPKTIPGDVVEITDIEEHKNYNQAKVKNYYKTSSNRVPILCPYYEYCGGCQLMGLSYSEQLEYKKEKVTNILKRYANLELKPTITESKEYHYRNKITLQVIEGKIGLFKHNTNQLIKVNHCLLISDKMNQLIKKIEQLNLKKISKIMIREAQEQLMIQIIGNMDEEKLIKTISSDVSSIYINERNIYGTPYIIDKLGKYEFQISPNSFFQVNHQQTINLYNKIKEYLGTNNNNILDLYCGTGTIGIYVSDYCKKVTGIEINASSVKDANKNIKRNNLNNIEIIMGDVGKVLKAKNTYEAIIVDPPRSGLDKRTKNILLQIKSPKIIYVSCDPITLARDLNELKEQYNIKDITLFDMFPNTYHVESVVLLSLK